MGKIRAEFNTPLKIEIGKAVSEHGASTEKEISEIAKCNKAYVNDFLRANFGLYTALIKNKRIKRKQRYAETIEKIKQLRRYKMTYGEIAKELNMSITTLKNIRYRYPEEFE